MKKVCRLIIWVAVSIVLTLPAFTFAQWVQKGPYGGTVYSIAVTPTRTYLGTDAGVCYTNDGGTTWHVDNFGLTDTYVQAVGVCGNRVFAATADSGVYFKENSGQVWARTSLNESVYAFATSGTNIFAGCSYAGVYMSTDNGATWTQMNNGLKDTYVRSIMALGSNIYVGTTDQGLFMSTDNGANWTQANNGLSGSCPYALASDGAKLYASLWASGLYSSTDGGANWVESNGGLSQSSDHHFYSIVAAGGKVFAGGAEGVYQSTDAGANWTEADNGFPSYREVNALALCGGNLVAGVTDSGVFVSSDNGATWRNSNSGLPRYGTNVLLVKGDSLLAGTNGGVFSSSDGGSTWMERMGHSHFRQFVDVTAMTLHSDTLYVGDVNGYVYYSSDNGDLWYPRHQVQWGATVTALVFAGSDMFASTKPYLVNITEGGGGVYRSTNSGTSWTRVSNGLPTLADTNTDVSSLVHLGTYLFAATPHGVYRSGDNGDSWVAVNNGIGINTGVKWINSLAVRGTELFAASYGFGIYHSTDYGATWTEVPNLLDVNGFDVIDNYLLADSWIGFGSGEGVFVLANSDTTWRNAGLSNLPANCFVLKDGNLYAGTSNGVWETPWSQVLTGTHQSPVMPSGFSLSQNYPNPFNPTTTIRFAVPSSGLVSLNVYDVLGRLVRTLVNERKSSGTYEVMFDASGLSSGVYFYRITAGSYSQAKKLLLMK